MGTLDITPEQAWRLCVAALDLVSYPSPATQRRVRRQVETDQAGSYPTVSPRDYVALCDMLDELLPGVVENASNRRHEAKAEASRRIAAETATRERARQAAGS